MKIPIEISARHVHLSKKDLDGLFGDGFKLTKHKNLSQPEQFASKQTVSLVGSKGKIDKVRVLGPCRQQTQIEVSKTDARELGVKPPVRKSGNLAGSAGIKIIGPKGEIKLAEGLIVALRHVHLDQKTADKLGLKNNDKIKIDVDGVRDLIFENVITRVSNKYLPAMHIDTDEANAASIDKKNCFGKIII